MAEISALEHEQTVLRVAAAFQTPRDAADRLRRHRPRAEPANGHGEISYLADAILEGALPRRRGASSAASAGEPHRPGGQTGPLRRPRPGQAGRLRAELFQRHRSDLPLRRRGQDQRSRPVGNHEFFEHLAREVVRLLSENTELGTAYRVDLRLRPDGQRGPMVMDLAGDADATTTCAAGPGSGRPTSRPGRWRATWTWASSSSPSLSPWIYRRYLSRADISGIKALKRRIEQQGPRRRPGPRRQDRATAASATSSSSSSSCNSSTAATCRSCGPATPWRP